MHTILFSEARELYNYFTVDYSIISGEHKTQLIMEEQGDLASTNTVLKKKTNRK